MAEYLAPGVYVEEIDSGMKPMEGVSTSTAGFVGMTQRGSVVGIPAFVGSYMDFQTKFGGYLPRSVYGERRYLPMAVEQFFANGGSRCFVVRLLEDANAKAASVTVGNVTFTAANVGAWGNLVKIFCKKDAMNPTIYNLTVACMESEKSGKAAYEESYAEVSLDPDAEGYLAKALEKSFILRAIVDTQPATTPADLYAAFQYAANPNAEDAKLLAAALEEENAAKAAMEAAAKAVKDAQEALDRSTDDTKQAAAAALTAANTELDTAAAAMNEKKAAVEEQRAKGLVNIRVLEAEIVADPALTAKAKKEWLSVVMTGGADCEAGVKPSDKVKADILKGSDAGPGKRTGLCAFKDIPEISIIAAPGVTEKSEIAELVTHCESMGNRICILDMPSGVNQVTELQQIRSEVNSSYAAMYHPWIQVFDPLEKRSAYLPPSGSLAGVYARVDNTRGVHKAPANETIRSCTGLETLFGKSEQDMLNPVGVNLIRNIQGQGIRVWGARTCSGDAAWKYINVRRLFIFLEESIRRNTGWAVFEPNDQLLWTKVYNSITSFLGTQWRNGALAGGSEAEAFFVNVGLGSSMTQDDVLSGRMICQIGVAPSRPAEFVIFRISQIMESNS